MRDRNDRLDAFKVDLETMALEDVYAATRSPLQTADQYIMVSYAKAELRRRGHIVGN